MKNLITRRKAIKAAGAALAVAGATIIAFPIIAKAGSPKAIVPMTADERDFISLYRSAPPKVRALVAVLLPGFADGTISEAEMKSVATKTPAYPGGIKALITDLEAPNRLSTPRAWKRQVIAARLRAIIGGAS